MLGGLSVQPVSRPEVYSAALWMIWFNSKRAGRRIYAELRSIACVGAAFNHGLFLLERTFPCLLWILRSQKLVIVLYGIVPSALTWLTLLGEVFKREIPAIKD